MVSENVLPTDGVWKRKSSNEEETLAPGSYGDPQLYVEEQEHNKTKQETRNKLWYLINIGRHTT